MMMLHPASGLGSFDRRTWCWWSLTYTPFTEANQSWQCGVEHLWHFLHFGRKGLWGGNPSERSIGMMFHVAGFSHTDQSFNHIHSMVSRVRTWKKHWVVTYHQSHLFTVYNIKYKVCQIYIYIYVCSLTQDLPFATLRVYIYINMYVCCMYVVCICYLLKVFILHGHPPYLSSSLSKVGRSWSRCASLPQSFLPSRTLPVSRWGNPKQTEAGNWMIRCVVWLWLNAIRGLDDFCNRRLLVS